MMRPNLKVAALACLAIAACGREKESPGADKASPTKNQEREMSSPAPDSPAATVVAPVPPGPRARGLADLLASAPPAWLRFGKEIQPTASPGDLEAPGERRSGPFKPNQEGKVTLAGKVVHVGPQDKSVTWMALSPAGSRILMQNGTETRIHDVTPEGNAVPSELPIPLLNYDSAKRWFLTKWVWLSETELVCALNIQSEDGDMIDESRLYHYNIPKRELSEVGLPEGLVNKNDPFLEITDVSGRSLGLKTLGEGKARIALPEDS